MITLQTTSIDVLSTLHNAGYQAMWAGGCVRDMLLNRPCKDIDIATSASPDEVLSLFEHTHELGKSFGVVQVILNEYEFEIATFRQDLAYHDGRHPEGYKPSTPEEDAQRRDFTINGLFYDPVEERLIDYVDGEADLKAGVLRAIGDPKERFLEDHLRMLRAIRFANTLGFEIEPATWAAIQEYAPLVAKVSPERIRVELTRTLLESQKAGTAFRMLLDSGLLAVVLPEAIPMDGQEQPPQFHPEGDVFTHVCLMLDFMEERSLQLAWSIVFHDIAKPATAFTTVEADGSERIRFNGHESVGADMAETIMRRLKFSNDDRDAIKICVANHMKYGQSTSMRKNTLRRIVGSPTFKTELELHRIDCQGCHGMLTNWHFLKEIAAEYENEPALPDPFIVGRDLMALGLTQGRDLGTWKNAAYDRQLEEPDLTKDDLLAWLRTELSDQKTDGQ